MFVNSQFLIFSSEYRNILNTSEIINIFRTIILIFLAVYHNVSAVERSGLLQVVGMSNLTLYFAHRGRLFKFHESSLMDVNYQLFSVNFSSESSTLPSPGIGLTSTLFGYITGSIQHFYPLCHVSLSVRLAKKLRTIVRKI